MACGLSLILASRASPETKSSGAGDGARSFYFRHSTLTGPPGTLLRTAPLTTSSGTTVRVDGARSLRLLNETQDAAGRTRISGGMAFSPITHAPRGGRSFVAWAHPTRRPANVALSSSREPLQGMEPWLGAMLRRGWIVVATDYAGLRTPGTQRYLSGNDEANDVVDSVRAVRHVVGARAGKDWVA